MSFWAMKGSWRRLVENCLIYFFLPQLFQSSGLLIRKVGLSEKKWIYLSQRVDELSLTKLQRLSAFDLQPPSMSSIGNQ